MGKSNLMTISGTADILAITTKPCVELTQNCDKTNNQQQQLKHSVSIRAVWKCLLMREVGKNV